MLGRVGPVGVHKGQQVAARGPETGLDRAAVAAIRLPDQPDRVLRRDLGGAVARAVVDDNTLDLVYSGGLDRGHAVKHTLHDLGDAVLFVICGNNNR